MGKGAILSGLLHGVVILLLLIGLPALLRRELEPPPVIPIDIVDISDITQAPDLKVKPKENAPKEEPKEKPQPPKPTPKIEEETEPEKKPEPEPESKVVEPELTMDDLLAPIEEEKLKSSSVTESFPIVFAA